MDILIGILLVIFAYAVFKSLWAVLITLICVAVAVFIVRRVRGSRKV